MKKRLLLLVVLLLVTVQLSAQTWEEIGFNLPDGDKASYNTLITFTTKDIGWVFTYTGKMYKLFKTTNGGQDWQKIKEVNKGGVIETAIFSMEPDFFYMINTDYSLSIGYDARFTTDGGITWDSTKISNEGFTSLHFFNQEKGIAISGRNSFSTTDGGRAWDRKGDIFLSRDSYFYNEKLGWSVGYSPFGNDAGCIAKTTNGGTSWFYQDSTFGIPIDYFGIEFLDSVKGFSVHGSVSKTIDGGENWQSVTGVGASDVGFLNKSNGWLTGGGQIFRTTDGGETWELQFESIKYFAFVKIIILKKDKIAYVLGVNPTSNTATLLKADLSKITGVEENKKTIPDEFNLLQNYPNPFNPTTTIKYEIPALTSLLSMPEGQVKVTLKVYDIIGREVATLVNEEKKAGRYETIFNGSNLSGGIYITRLTAGKYNKSIKICLLK